MAGDWIKMRTSLVTSPKVNGIARILERSTEVGRMLAVNPNVTLSDVVTRNVTRYVTVSLLLSVWSAANEHTSDGIFHNADLSDVDDIVGVPGFGQAMASVGWAIHDVENDCVILPNFNDYNKTGTERHASAAERQRRYREKKRATSDVTRDVTEGVTGDDREEKRRDEKSKDLNPEREHAGEGSSGNDFPGDFTPPPAEDHGDGFGFGPLGKFPMTDFWTPSPNFVKQAGLWGRNIGAEPGYTTEELQQFRDYWVPDGKVKHQLAWEQTFANSLMQSRVRTQRSSPAGARDMNQISQPDKTIPSGFRGQP